LSMREVDRHRRPISDSHQTLEPEFTSSLLGN
jgi:hypothetical protein